MNELKTIRIALNRLQSDYWSEHERERYKALRSYPITKESPGMRVWKELVDDVDAAIAWLDKHKTP